MPNNSNMQNEQMEINIYKILSFFKISRTHVWEMTPFSWFRTPIEKKCPFFRENECTVSYNEHLPHMG